MPRDKVAALRRNRTSQKPKWPRPSDRKSNLEVSPKAVVPELDKTRGVIRGEKNKRGTVVAKIESLLLLVGKNGPPGKGEKGSNWKLSVRKLDVGPLEGRPWRREKGGPTRGRTPRGHPNLGHYDGVFCSPKRSRNTFKGKTWNEEYRWVGVKLLEQNIPSQGQ